MHRHWAIEILRLGLVIFLVAIGATAEAKSVTCGTLLPGRLTVAGVDLDVTYISREPRYEWSASKKWPHPGETVTFTAHIINKGSLASGPFAFQWRIDDQFVAAGQVDNLASQAETMHTLNWVWETGRHYVSFEVDPDNQIAEAAETNNLIRDPTDALTIAFWVEEGVYNEFNNIQNGAGTYSWEDWAQHILAKMNWMFEKSAYPLAPAGAPTRVRLDLITIVPNGTLFYQGPDHAPNDEIYDGRWGFSMEEYHNCQCCPTAVCYDMPWWVIHELMHYLYNRIDLYTFTVEGGDVKVRDDSDNLIAGTPLLPYINWDVVYYASRNWDLMNNAGEETLFSDYTIYSLNKDWPMGQRIHPGGDDWEYYFKELPAETKIRVLNNNDQPLANVQVSLYQAVAGDGTSGPYSQNFDNIPDITGITDSEGLFSLGSQPFGNLEQYGTPQGVALIKLHHPISGQSRYVWLELTDLNLASWRGEIVYIHDVRFPKGQKRLKLSQTELVFTTWGETPTPQSIKVGLIGDGVAQWSVADTTAPWLRTLPSPDLSRSLPTHPFGPLTFVVEEATLPTGVYTTTVTVDAGIGVLDSPQPVTVTLKILPKDVYLPLVLKKYK